MSRVVGIAQTSRTTKPNLNDSTVRLSVNLTLVF